jgi:hypothetical protein
VGAGLGEGFTLTAWNTADTYKSTRDFDRRPALRQEMEGEMAVAQVAFVVAGVAAVAAAVLFVLSG